MNKSLNSQLLKAEQKDKQTTVDKLSPLFTFTTKTSPFILYLCILMVLIVGCKSTQIQIISTPTSQQMKSLYLMKSLRRYRERYINLNNQTFACVTAIKQKPTNADSSSFEKSKLINHYVNGNLPTQAQMKLDPNAYTKQLDLLDDGIGVRHYTKQFIYGYKHKRIISQFDDEFTKHNNQKKQFENFTMGIYDVSLIQNTKQSQAIPNPDLTTYQTDHMRQQSLVRISNLLKDENKQLSRKYAQEAIKYAYIDHQSKIITLTSPLSIRKHTVSKSYNITFQCQSDEGSTNHSLLGVSITNYQIQLISPIPAICKKVLSIYQAHKLMLSFKPVANIIGDKIFGDLDKMCNVGNDNGLHEGDFILLQTRRNVQVSQPRQKKEVGSKPKVDMNLDKTIKIQIDPETGQAIIISTAKTVGVPKQSTLKMTNNHETTEFFIVQIARIVGQNVYMINAELPWTLKIEKCQKVDLAQQHTIDYGGQFYIANDKLSPGYQITNKQKSKIIQLQIVNKKMLMKNTEEKRVKAGDELLCFAEYSFTIGQTVKQIEYFALTVGQNFNQNYFQIYPWTYYFGVMVSDYFGTISQKINCLPYQKSSQKASRQIYNLKNGIFSSILKMSKQKNNKVKFQQKTVQSDHSSSNQKLNQDSILMLTMSKHAVVQLTTIVYEEGQETSINKQPQTSVPVDNQPSQAKSATDLKQEAKVQQGKTFKKEKKEIGINKYYLTSQKIYKIETNFRNNTKIRVERLQNGFYENSTNQNQIIIHKGIWRAGDFLKFPRFLFNSNERLSAVYVKYGSVFVRVVDLARINRQYFVVSSTQFNQHSGYGPKTRPTKSISAEHKFKFGTFCGGNINKNRQSLVKIKCGEPWFKLHSVTETMPCVYEIQIISQFLCDKNVVFPALKQGVNTFSGSLCLPAEQYEKE